MSYSSDEESRQAKTIAAENNSQIIKSFEQDEESCVAVEEVNVKELDKVYRRLDYRIIPALWCLYFLTSFGSSAYGLTLTMNKEVGHSLTQSLKLSSHHTATASALYYVGYILFDVPMNLVMTKVHPQTWLSRIVITVGFVYACYSVLHNAGGLIAARFISGLVGAGTWPGMSYYISLWYPNDRSTRRIGYYFTAAQISAAVAGLVSAGFQKMDGMRGYMGWQWMYLVYGTVTVCVGISLLWWLPDRPFAKPSESTNKFKQFYFTFFKSPHPLSGTQRELHRKDLEHRYKLLKWTWKDVSLIITDLRIWPIIIMYFGVVGTGFGLAVFGSTIIAVNNPRLSSIQVSLLYAPIWLFDLGGILILTPFADKYKRFRAAIFSGACLIIMTGMFVTTFAHGSWNKYAGLLIAGFGLGPTVPICMSWSAEIFQPRYGDVGTAVSAALVSGLGNLGSVTATYALYSGWPADVPRLFKYSNMMLVVMLGVSIIASGVCHLIRNKVRQ
ncbi:high affinity nicotinic acid plasma membrane permease [Spathaspora passalidarum NRRL Y-27907]|uniref:High affinity nicotinic acid plasma membrane permease n=1 Tax=Spathaspora passalidarum (strain NRRL Y-27907 / 11-Y1) TaxID=619300 RepID=G3AI22_SPAPN|nr:high affinity nicotinic acid plasma membrane permease [Spathaspora passalidarum NRRL Y-27907]EGW34336.1 high affinity nicotinic acid plasma membrane permease [Spathaspora passalidarum NRRL Y-27907]